MPGGDRRIADDVIAYSQVNNITHIVIGKSMRTRWFELLHGSVVRDLIRRAGNISVHVIAGEAVQGEPIPKKVGATPPRRRHPSIRAHMRCRSVGRRRRRRRWRGAVAAGRP